MDNREAAAALRESIRVNGKAQAAPDEDGDSDDEGDETSPPIKVQQSMTCSMLATGRLSITHGDRRTLMLTDVSHAHIPALVTSLHRY